MCCQMKGSSFKVTAQIFSSISNTRKIDALQAAGNSFNILQAGLMLAPLLRAAVVAGKLGRGVRQPHLSPQELSSLCFAEVRDAPSTKPAAVSPTRKRAKNDGNHRRGTQDLVMSLHKSIRLHEVQKFDMQ